MFSSVALDFLDIKDHKKKKLAKSLKGKGHKGKKVEFSLKNFQQIIIN